MAKRLCSRCKNTRVGGDGKYCRECRAAYQAEYREMELRRERIGGCGEGVEAMRATLANEFERQAFALVRCTDVADAIRRAPKPSISRPGPLPRAAPQNR